MKEHWRQGKHDRISELKSTLMIFVIVILFALAMYVVGQQIESSSESAEPHGDLSRRFTQVPAVEYGDNLYCPHTRLTTILVMGIDQYAADASQNTFYRNGGQADYLLLLVIDDEAKTITPIQIDRDTMAEISILGVLGSEAGTRTEQICLQHGFGDGGKQSCEFTQQAVSRLLLGVQIDFYVALDMGGIATLNDAVGGVTLTLQDDFTSLDPTMLPGATLTLHGIQAEYYVRNRMNIGIGTNASRMVRQQTYWEGLASQLMTRLETDGNANFIGNLFDQLKPYLITDMKRGRIINEAWSTRKYERFSTLHPEGTYSTGEDGFVEFAANPAALSDLVIQAFYSKVL